MEDFKKSLLRSDMVLYLILIQFVLFIFMENKLIFGFLVLLDYIIVKTSYHFTLLHFYNNINTIKKDPNLNTIISNFRLSFILLKIIKWSTIVIMIISTYNIIYK